MYILQRRNVFLPIHIKQIQRNIIIIIKYNDNSFMTSKTILSLLGYILKGNKKDASKYTYKPYTLHRYELNDTRPGNKSIFTPNAIESADPHIFATE